MLRALSLSIALAVATPALASASPSNTVPGDGSYLVGVDVAPGLYKTAGPGRTGFCTWATHSSMPSGTDDIVDSGFAMGGQLYAQIRPTARFSLGTSVPGAYPAPRGSTKPAGIAKTRTRPELRPPLANMLLVHVLQSRHAFLNPPP